MNFYQTIKERQTLLTINRLGYDLNSVEQGSAEWHRARLGVITGSRASDLIATGPLAPFPDDVEITKTGRQNTVVFDGKEFTGTKAECVSFVRNHLPRLPSSARTDYMLELVAEVATGQAAEHGQFRQTEWGHQYENHARQIFAFHVGATCLEIPFIYADESMRCGISPDGIADEFSGIEIKCPYTTKVYLDFLLNGKIKSEYLDQVQYSMFVTGLPYWHFCNYDPRMKVSGFHAVTIERDESMMKTFEDATGQMIHDVDTALARLGLRFGDQWKPLNTTEEISNGLGQ